MEKHTLPSAVSYRQEASDLPRVITPRDMPTLNASTHGTRCLASAMRVFDAQMGPLGWDLDEVATTVGTWTGDGCLVARRGPEVRRFILAGDYSIRLTDQWRHLATEPARRPAGVYRCISDEVSPADGGQDWSAYRLLSSNRRKLLEYARYGLPLALSEGEDLPEVDGTPDEVIVRKSEAAGGWTVVEDTVLEINGRPVVDIRWRVEELTELDGATARFTVSLAANDGVGIKVWHGHVDGMLRVPSVIPEDAFGFEPFFAPHRAGGLTLHDLDIRGRKDSFSARAVAARGMLADRPSLEVSLSDLEPWAGPWQSGCPASYGPG